MTNYTDQIQRIKEKLFEAKMADKNLKVFGADRHKYIINKPTTISEIEEIEKKYFIQLPECYKSFILYIGNGGISYKNSAAGPSYGIYPLGISMNELIVENTEKYLFNDCIISPEMTDEYWNSLTKPILRLENSLSEEEYIKQEVKVFGGILPISSQGCSYLSGIVLNGVNKGRVVYLDIDLQKPIFSKEVNFLDWYEREWLDKIICGSLIPKEKGRIEKKWYNFWK